MEKVISSEKEPQEESIYDDIICQGDLGLTIHNLKSKNLQLQLHVTSLEEDIQKLCDRITEMKQIQDNLSRNISELYKTAKSEIDRKDRLISELQLKIDDMVFKRNTAPSNFGVKRYREEDRSSEVVGNKKVRCDVKTITDEDQLRDKNEYNNAIHKDVHRDDKKKDADESRNYRSADIQGERSRNSSRNDDRRRDEYSSRSDKTRRRRSISRDRGRRDSRNCRDNQGKDRFEYTRRRRDNDFRDQGIRKDCRGPRSRNERSRNEFEVERNKDHDKNELISRHEILKSEPRFSSAESSRSTPEIIYPKSTLNESKEEGEVSENEAENKKENSSLDKRSKRNDKANKTIENVKYSTNYREDQNKQFDVTKFITRQQDISRKKDVKIKTKEKSLGTIETNDRNESHRKENVSSKKENVAGKKENQKEESILSESTMKDIDERITKAKENENTKSTKSTRIQRKSEIESVTIENTDLNEEDQVISETKNENVTILSQILLTQGKVESIQDTKLKPVELPGEESQKTEIQKFDTNQSMKTIKTIPKVNKKPRESRIPRNLSGELDIKLEKPKLEKKEKQEGKKINQANRVKEKISSLFDTPVKELAPRNLVNFNETFCLTQDGEIPILQFENSETSSNQSVINIKETSTPVSEFQIFKTNLPSVERSSSLPTVSTQLQVNITSSVSGKNIDREQKASNNQSSDNHQKTSSAEGTSKVRNSLEQQCFQDVINSGQVVVANENLGYGNTSDMCNISLDLLNTHLGDYRAEDYPNLTAHSENRDISNLLLTPENISKQKVQIKDDSIKSLNLKNILEKTDETIHNSKYEKVDDSEKNETIESINNTNDSVDPIAAPNLIDNTSPSTRNERRKRKRCIIKWAE